MSKGQGQKITIKFTQPILSGANVLRQKTIETQQGVWSANGTYSGSDINNAKDDNTSTLWQSRSTSNYIQIDLGDIPKLVQGFKIYCGDIYRPSTYKISISNDGVNFTQINTGSILGQTGWQTIMLNTYHLTKFVRINFGYSSRLYVFELALITVDWLGGFKITGQEEKRINGNLINKDFLIADIQPHPTLGNTHIQLVMDDISGRINNAEGEVTIEYDASVGNLVGQAGAVESFTETFTPTDLIPVPNPHVAEHIEITPTATVEFIKVNYNHAYADEHIEITPTANVNFVYVGIVNP